MERDEVREKGIKGSGKERNREGGRWGEGRGREWERGGNGGRREKGDRE